MGGNPVRSRLNRRMSVISIRLRCGFDSLFFEPSQDEMIDGTARPMALLDGRRRHRRGATKTNEPSKATAHAARTSGPAPPEKSEAEPSGKQREWRTHEMIGLSGSPDIRASLTGGQRLYRLARKLRQARKKMGRHLRRPLRRTDFVPLLGSGQRHGDDGTFCDWLAPADSSDYAAVKGGTQVAVSRRGHVLFAGFHGVFIRAFERLQRDLAIRFWRRLRALLRIGGRRI